MQKTISVPPTVACEACRGTGAEGGAEPTTCPTCKGWQACEVDGPTPQHHTHHEPCPTCEGMGWVEEETE